MFYQLGNIIFTGLLSPHSFSVEGDEATYAEHNLIGGKPRLQLTGSTLQQITQEIKFHAEFCNPTDQIAKLRAAREAGSILPFLWGDGRYINDYVIISHPYTIDEAFDDGTIKQATVTLTIREYVSYDRLEQRQQAQRKAAFAIGVKNPVIRRTPQPDGQPKIIAMEVTQTIQQTNKADSLVSDYEHNVSNRGVLANKILKATKQAQDHLDSFNSELDKAKEIENKFTGLRASAQNVANAVEAVKNLYPYPNVNALKAANTILQGGASSFRLATSGLFENIAVRQPIN
jgi:phage protein U